MLYDGIIFNGFTWRGLDKHFQFPMIGPYRLRTFLKQYGYNLEVIEWFDWWTEEEIIRLIEDRMSNNLKFVGFSTTFQATKNISVNLISTIRSKFPRLKIIFGGQEPPEQLLGEHPEMSKYIDSVFYGHSEVALLEYLKHIENKPNRYNPEKYSTGVEYIISPNVVPYQNNEDLSTIWEKDDPVKYFKTAVIEISRGCMFKCKFCFSPLIGRKKSDYTRSPENFAEELKRNYDLFGITHYAFSDDTLNESNEKLENLKKGIKLSGVDITFTAYLRYELMHVHKEQTDTLLEMGLVGGIFGIETFNPESRKSIGKGLSTDQILELLYNTKKKTDRLMLSSAFISGLPGEDEESTTASFQDFLKLNSNFEYLDAWYWTPLYLVKPYKYLSSIFTREAETYGYNVLHMGKWTNDKIAIKSFDEAEKMAQKLNNLYTEKLNASTQISQMMSHGIPLEEALKYKGSVSKLQQELSYRYNNIFQKYKKEKGILDV